MSGINIHNFINFTGNIASVGQTVQKTDVSLNAPLKADTFEKSTAQSKPKSLDYLDELDPLSRIKVIKARLKKNSRRDLEKLSNNELLNICKMKVEADKFDNKQPRYQEINRALNYKIENKDINSPEEFTLFLENKRIMYTCGGIEDEYTDKIIYDASNLIENCDRFDAKDYEEFIRYAIIAGSDEALDKLTDSISKRLETDGRERFDKHLQTLKDCFDIEGVEITGRLKSKESIQRKLESKINRFNAQPLNVADKVPDVCAYRITSDGSKEKIEEIVSALIKGVDEGKFIPKYIISRGQKELQYITDEQAERLKNKGFGVYSKTYGNIICENVELDDEDGNHFELQIIGDKTNELNKAEHGFYKMDTKEGERFKSIQGRHQLDAYDAYIRQCYIYTRNQELGVECDKPELPDGIAEDLSLV